MLERSLNGLLGLSRAAQVDSNLSHCAACLRQTLLKALTAQCKSGVTDLLVDTKGVFDTSSAHFLTATYAGLLFGLADMNQNSQALSDIGARVDRDHWDTGSYSCFNRGTQSRRIGDRDDKSSRVCCHRSINEMGHRYHVEGG